VTTPDAVTVYQGNLAAVKPVANDHDPDNELVALCRVGTEHYRGVMVATFGDELDVLAKPNAKPGTYTFTYYACDYTYLVPGTVTVTVQKLPKIPVEKIASRPGALRVTNPTDGALRFLYGSFDEEKPDGSVLIPRNSTVVVPVTRTTIDWVASDRSGEVFYGTGRVSGIKLAHGHHRGTSVALPARLADAWRAH
jgi:hypothetical protein